MQNQGIQDWLPSTLAKTLESTLPPETTNATFLPAFSACSCIAAASRLPNEAGLVYKVLGLETQPVRALVRRFWEVARPIITGCPVPPEFAWR